MAHGLEELEGRIERGWWPVADVGPGWAHILTRLNAKLALLNPEYRIQQVKRVGGALLFEVTAEDAERPEFRAAIDTAKDEARRTCERCGLPGALRDLVTGCATLCDVHHRDLTRPLSAEEGRFVAGSGLDMSVLGTEAEKANRAHRAWSETELRSAGLTDLDDRRVAELLRLCVPRVQMWGILGNLAIAERDGRMVYPRWQFATGQGILPGLRLILLAFPADSHARDIESVMTTPTASLDGLSPREWLADGGDPDAIVQLVLELGYL